MRDTSQTGLISHTAVLNRLVQLGLAEYFAVYLPDNGKVYMISVDEAPKRGDMTLRFKGAGLVRGNHKKTKLACFL